jgi:hypothetical protein
VDDQPILPLILLCISVGLVLGVMFWSMTRREATCEERCTTGNIIYVNGVCACGGRGD